MHRARPLALGLVLLASLCLAAPALAGPADLDTSFDTDGYISGHFTTSSMGWEQVLPRSDGTILAVGGTSSVTATDPDLYSGGSNDFVVGKFNEDGSPFVGFGTGGFKLIDFNGYPDNAWAIGVQGSGKIIVGGVGGNGGGATSPIGVARLNDNGTLDTSFGNATPTANGKTTLTVGTNNAYVKTIDIGVDDSIGMGVEATDNTSGTAWEDFTAVKLLAGGTIDTGFGLFDGPTRNGIRMISMDVKGDHTAGAHMLSDGSFYITGDVIPAFGLAYMGIAKLEPDSDLDPSFGGAPTGGKSIINPSFNTWGERVVKSVIAPDGKLVLVGSTDDSAQTDFFVARFNTDGSLDTTFGGDGFVQQAIGIADDGATAVDVHSDGSIVVGGTTENGSDRLLFLARYLSDGTLDSTFGTGGILSVSLATTGLGNVLDSIAVDDQERILFSGIYDTGGSGMSPFIGRLAGGIPVVPAPPAEAGPPPANVAPATGSASITEPDDGDRFSRRKLLRIIGRSTTANGGRVDRVELALQRVVRGKCLWLSSSKARFKRSTKGSGPCAKTKWLKTSGTGDWSYRLKKRLPKGNYRLYARAVLTDGTTEQTFVSKVNAVDFRVR